MKILFTRNSLPLSRLIRWVLKEPVSHLAIVFDDHLVFHSNLMGVHLEWFNSFKKHHEIVYEVTLFGMTLEQEERTYRAIVDQFDGAPYDFKGLLYFGVRGFLWRLFGTPFPAHNPWGSRRAFLCTEVIGTLPQWAMLRPTAYTGLDMISPYQIYKTIEVKHDSQ
jgi:hypothetical protein